ncbi:MAG TPA: HAMP domain-containing sensor histidine kinase [Lachnospiraceae bacterium]|nr:HAMP domain-containing sensor histidine kinase [Lachnospiraceae bacterium]
MKKHKGLTIKKSIMIHGLQQFSAFIAFTCLFLILFYSYVSVSYNSQDNTEERMLFDVNLFNSEKRFEDTGTFDEMLIKAIKEIIRYNVAKSQLEVNGKFDGSKIIDIEAFVNRKNDLQHGMDTVIESSAKNTLTYYLEDLIKWEKYGIFYDEVTMSEEEFVTYFGNKVLDYYDGNLTQDQKNLLNKWLANGFDEIDLNTSYATDEKEWIINENSNSDNTTSDSDSFIILSDNDEELTEYYVKVHQAFADILKQTEVVDRVYFDIDTRKIMVGVMMLQERYQPADKSSLVGHAESWLSYQTITDHLIQAVEDLSYNYSEYLAFSERYNQNASNIKYTFKMTMMGESVEVDNLVTKVSDTGLDQYYKSNYGKYMIYRPQTMYFESNTGIINENMLFQIFSNYEYAYPETAQIWIAVNTDYPVIDSFAIASNVYAFLHPIAYVIFGIGVASICLWFIFLLYMSVMTGYRCNKDEKEGMLLLHWFDSIPTEIAAVLGIGIGAAIVYLGSDAGEDIAYRVVKYTCSNRFFMSLLLGFTGMLISMLFCLFWYSLVRRSKSHTLWKECIMRKIWFGILNKIFILIKEPVLKLLDSMNIWIRGFFYLGTVMLFNFCMGVLCYRSWRYQSLREVVLWLFLGFFLTNGLVFALWISHRVKQKRIVEGIKKIRDGELNYQVSLEGMHGDNLHMAEAVNSIGEGIKTAVETSMKDERLKADLITNVSHDIKTPLTSIINYVNLLKRQNIETDPVKGYIEILENKSLRLKQLTEDLLEASKISSGNITLCMEKINLIELINQSIGEFSEKFEEKNLSIVDGLSQEAVYIEADSRRIWRVIENIFSNIYKYALGGTRVYLDLEQFPEDKRAVLSVKNISAQPLNIKAEELTERFIRGDVSRNTEGSGLGLSIAKNLTELQHGKFQIYLDGDLFKITLEFPFYEEKE